jgi:hypothetical protein
VCGPSFAALKTPVFASGSVLSVFTTPFPQISVELVSTASALALVSPGHSTS